jgi:nucleotide-binding universal stress UspA family protein
MKSTVVVGYDQTPSSEHALLEAAREASWRSGALTVVTAYQWLSGAPPVPLTYSPTEIAHSIRKAATAVAEHGADLARAKYPGMPVTVVAREGATADVLTDAAREAGLLVVGNRGRGGFAGLLLGSVSMRTLATSRIPTMVVRGPDHGPHDLVVAAVDIMELGGEPLEYAFAEASRRGARLEVLHAWDVTWFLEASDNDVKGAAKQATSDREEALERAMLPCRAEHPEVRAVLNVVDGTTGAVLTEASRRADLVVVGARLRHADDRGMRVGPVAHELLHHADCPVVVVPRP